MREMSEIAVFSGGFFFLFFFGMRQMQKIDRYLERRKENLRREKEGTVDEHIV